MASVTAEHVGVGVATGLIGVGVGHVRLVAVNLRRAAQRCAALKCAAQVGVADGGRSTACLADGLCLPK